MSDTIVTETIKAPFTPDQVAALEEFQQHRGIWEYVPMHEFTCGNDRMDELHRGGGVLVPTARGWVCPYCDYTQDWAHRFMCEPGAFTPPFIQFCSFDPNREHRPDDPEREPLDEIAKRALCAWNNVQFPNDALQISWARCAEVTRDGWRRVSVAVYVQVLAWLEKKHG